MPEPEERYRLASDRTTRDCNHAASPTASVPLDRFRLARLCDLGELESGVYWPRLQPYFLKPYFRRLTYRLTGQYDNRYVKRNDRWYIQVQKFRQTSLLIKKVAEDGSEKIVTFGMPDGKVFDK